MFNLRLPYYSPLFTGTQHASQLRKGWGKATSAANLTVDGTGRKVLTPKLSEISIASEDGQQVTALVDMSTVGRQPEISPLGSRQSPPPFMPTKR
jgi:hypothetical protein